MSQVATSGGLFARSIAKAAKREETREAKAMRPPAGWSAQIFAREQVLGLVRQLFLSGQERRVRHILVSAIDRETDVSCVCRLAGEALALQDLGNVAVLGSYPQLCHERSTDSEFKEDGQGREKPPLRQSGSRLSKNLWLLPGSMGDRVSITSQLHSNVCALRREFDFSIVEGPIADSYEALAIAQIVDGVVLVLSARHTRRATARKVKHALESASVRILGAVLVDRAFPIPENIYRRL